MKLGRYHWRLGVVLGLVMCALIVGPFEGGYAQTVVTTIPVGAGPRGVAVNPATNLVYVANNGANSVSIINGATNMVSNTVPVGVQPRGVAVLPGLNRVYVANQGADTVTVLDGTTGAFVTTISVGDEPVGVAANPNTNFVYVTNAGPGMTGNSLSVIDGATNGVVTTIDTRRFPTGPAAPFSVTVNPTLNRIYVANFSENTVAVIDGATHTRMGTPQPVGNGPIGITVNPSTSLVYTANVGSSDLAVVNAGGTQIGNIPLGGIPNDVAFNPSTNRLFTAGGSHSVTFVNANTHTVEGGVASPPGSGTTKIAVNSTTNRVYVTLGNASSVFVLQDGVPAATPTLTPTRTPTPTVTPTPNPCLPRPRVNVATVPSTGNRLQVTVSTTNASAPNNQISAIQFTSTPGALVDIPNGQQGASGSFTVNPNAPQFQFFVRQQTAGQAATAFFVVTDACGGWQTFAGGGPSAFGGGGPSGPSAPVAGATATATATRAAAACVPRPAVSVTTAPGAAGQLQVTVAAGGNAALQALRFGTATNALIDAGDHVGGTGSFTVTLPPGTRQTTFIVRRATAAQAATVNLVAVDSCGEWPTMIGGGAAAF